MLVEHDLLARVQSGDRSDIFEYHLTTRGLDTYPYALSLMKWGDQQLPRKAKAPVTLRHDLCGRMLNPIAVCAECDQTVRAEDVIIDPKSIAAPEQDAGTKVRYSSRPELYTAGRPTSVSRALATIGDRWGFFVIWLGLAGVTKFEHFHGVLGIARTTLTARLGRLVELGLFERVQYETRPPRFEYHLTEAGKALCPVLLTLRDWGNRGMNKSQRDSTVLHRKCGKPLSIHVVCSNCKQVAEPKQVTVMSVALLGK